MDNLNTIKQKEHPIWKLFKYSGLGNYFNIIYRNLKWMVGDKYIVFDIALYKNDILYAVFKIKENLNSSNLEFAKKEIENFLKLTKCRFGIIADSNRYLLIDYENPTKENIETDFNKITKLLLHPNQIQEGNNEETNIKKALKLYFNKEEEITSIFNDIKYDKNQGLFSFEDLEKERTFFMNIIGSINDNETIYRYTTLDTLFTMLNKGTYRMNGIMGMNDKSEINYFDNKCTIEISPIEELNNTYLSSCSSMKDDLTMWRLYGDDGKGVCLEFEFSPSGKENNDFIWAHVNYAEKTSHKALKMLKEMSDAKMKFKQLYKWKHFFKPYNFSAEKEIRLMFIDNGRYDNGVVNRDWVKTLSHSIINPIVDFKLNSKSFPIQLRRIILGPKMQEKSTNLTQIDYLLSLKEYSIKVEQSEIDYYR